MAAHRDRELADEKLREPCRKVLVSLNEHWTGLTLFVDDPMIPMDNNYGERLIRNPAVGRKNEKLEVYQLAIQFVAWSEVLLEAEGSR